MSDVNPDALLPEAAAIWRLVGLGRPRYLQFMEHSANILRELRPWHVLTARCSQCGRQGVVQRCFLGEAQSLAEVQRRLRCCRCQNRDLNQLTVANALH